ncbi:hypothetical protein ACIGCK_07415 [Microbacterium sp. NPDC078428]|uniref:hypothetical protein n=1 Tax=Microbacterium sp. NPDC078428 TaxID=3364190 RepID=UPI0037CA16D1
MTDDEAFAAAEATYRAYVDALNQVDLSDPNTFEAVYAWTTGEANANARATFSRMHANGWAVEGTTSFDALPPVVQTGDELVLNICLSVGSVDVTDSSGRSMVPPDRRDDQPLRVSFEQASSATGLLIRGSEASNHPSCVA